MNTAHPKQDKFNALHKQLIQLNEARDKFAYGYGDVLPSINDNSKLHSPEYMDKVAEIIMAKVQLSKRYMELQTILKSEVCEAFAEHINDLDEDPEFR